MFVAQMQYILDSKKNNQNVILVMQVLRLSVAYFRELKYNFAKGNEKMDLLCEVEHAKPDMICKCICVNVYI